MLSKSKTIHSHKTQIIILIAILFLVYAPSLFNGFVNWDDVSNVVKNQFVQVLDLKHIVDIFTTTVNKTYIPLTSLTFSIEHHFFGHNPLVYHLNNLLLHICVSVMVFIFALHCGLSSRAAMLGALVFGLHPMHVESVAWITERKDVLYAFFYMLSVLMYCRYLHVVDSADYRFKARMLFVLVFLFAILSVLSKPMALSLPLVLFLLDWYFKRKFRIRLILEKIYILSVYVPIVWVSFFLHTGPVKAAPVKSVLIWLWCFLFYLRKFFIPDHFMLFYKLPTPVALSNFAHLSSVLLFLIFIGGLLFFRKKRLFVFSSFFYFWSIFFLLRMDPSTGAYLTADRFMYLPSVGWCLLLGYAGNKILSICENSKTLRIFSRTLCLIIFSLLIISTMNQIRVWESGVTLWKHQLSMEPRVAPALIYTKLAQAYTEEDRFNINDQHEVARVENLYKKALEVKPDYAYVYLELGKLHFRMKEYDKAERLLSKAIDLDQDHFDAYFSLGQLYYARGYDNKGLKAFSQAMRINPENELIYQEITRFYLNNVKYSRDHSVFQKEYNTAVVGRTRATLAGHPRDL